MANKTVFNTQQAQALCNLYKVVPASMRIPSNRRDVTILSQLKHGIIFVDKNYAPVVVNEEVFRIADEMYGVNADVMTNTFYKSFKTVTEKTLLELFVDQVIHYLGTYGRESIGLPPLTLIPMQELEVPEVDLSTVKVTVIRIVDEGTIVNLVNDTLLNTKMPSKRIVEAMKELISFADMDLNDIRSFELATMAFDHFGVVPRNGRMVLRYLIYKLTGETLVIKNQRLVRMIKESDFRYGPTAHDILAAANPVELASIFLRYKPLFLAMKTHLDCAPIINRLRRMADTYHRPLDANTIQNYVRFAIEGKRTALKEIRKSMDTRDMIKVMNAMLVRLHTVDGDPAVFNVRNGRSYCVEATHKSLTRKQHAALDLELNNLYAELANTLRKTIGGKSFYIPENIVYALPQSEKQFVGNIPWGSCVKTGHDAVTVGVSWFNQGRNGEERVDLDLHCFTPTQHYGWNSAYTNGGAEVIYSGDMTNAPLPNGAAEAFWIAGVDEPVIFTLNAYCAPDEMPFKLYFSDTKVKTYDDWARRDSKPYTMNPNELVMSPIPLKFHSGERGCSLGFLDHGQFFFYSGNLSNSAVPKGNYAKFLEAIMNQQMLHLNLHDVLIASGAKVYFSQKDYDAAVEDGEVVVDLSPEALTADTLLNIVDGKA